MYQRLLVFAAHSDDEITMAGTLAEAAREGCAIIMVTMTDGGEGYPRMNLKRRIVSLRRQEAAACDRVLGVRHHIFLNQPDMGLIYHKKLLQRLVKIIRKIRPEAIFTHGPIDCHTDHRAAHEISVDACWQAGEPVSAELGKSWKTPVLYFYKGVGPGMDPLPCVVRDVSRFAFKRFEALATQESQFALFKSSRSELLAKARTLKAHPETTRETFWIAATNRFERFPDF